MPDLGISGQVRQAEVIVGSSFILLNRCYNNPLQLCQQIIAAISFFVGVTDLGSGKIKCMVIGTKQYR